PPIPCGEASDGTADPRAACAAPAARAPGPRERPIGGPYGEVRGSMTSSLAPTVRLKPRRVPPEWADVIVPVEQGIAEIRAGRMAAERITPEAVNFMAKYGRGLICLSLTEERIRQLRLPMMVPDQDNTTTFGTAFTISIEARHGVTTGISAADRAHTIRVAIHDASTPHDFSRPGHVFPLRAGDGGVLRRAGQTEGSVVLARLAGFKPGGVIGEIMIDDGSMARMPDL